LRGGKKTGFGGKPCFILGWFLVFWTNVVGVLDTI